MNLNSATPTLDRSRHEEADCSLRGHIYTNGKMKSHQIPWLEETPTNWSFESDLETVGYYSNPVLQLGQDCFDFGLVVQVYARHDRQPPWLVDITLDISEIILVPSLLDLLDLLNRVAPSVSAALSSKSAVLQQTHLSEHRQKPDRYCIYCQANR